MTRNNRRQYTPPPLNHCKHPGLFNNVKFPKYYEDTKAMYKCPDCGFELPCFPQEIPSSVFGDEFEGYRNSNYHPYDLDSLARDVRTHSSPVRKGSAFGNYLDFLNGSQHGCSRHGSTAGLTDDEDSYSQNTFPIRRRRSGKYINKKHWNTGSLDGYGGYGRRSRRDAFETLSDVNHGSSSRRRLSRVSSRDPSINGSVSGGSLADSRRVDDDSSSRKSYNSQDTLNMYTFCGDDCSNRYCSADCLHRGRYRRSCKSKCKCRWKGHNHCPSAFFSRRKCTPGCAQHGYGYCGGHNDTIAKLSQGSLSALNELVGDDIHFERLVNNERSPAAIRGLVDAGRMAIRLRHEAVRRAAQGDSRAIHNEAERAKWHKRTLKQILISQKRNASELDPTGSYEQQRLYQREIIRKGAADLLDEAEGLQQRLKAMEAYLGSV